MELTELKEAIDDYCNSAENGLLKLKERLDSLEVKLDTPNQISAEYHTSKLEG